MKHSEIILPALPGASVNPPREISQSKLSQPLSGGAYRPKLDDEFEFTVMNEEGTRPYAVEQDIANSEYTSTNIACMRNGKPSWISLGQFTQRDKDGKSYCPVCEELRSCTSVEDLLDKISGKKIKVTKMVNVEIMPFGQTIPVKQDRPYLEWA